MPYCPRTSKDGSERSGVSGMRGSLKGGPGSRKIVDSGRGLLYITSAARTCSRSLRLPKSVPFPRSEIIIEPVYWAPVLQKRENDLWGRVQQGTDLDFLALRQLMIDFAADAIAYQPAPKERDVYDGVHEVVAKTLGLLPSQWKSFVEEAHELRVEDGVPPHF